MTIFFQIPVQKYTNKAFLVPNLVFLFFNVIFKLDIFEGADFKCDNNIFKL